MSYQLETFLHKLNKMIKFGNVFNVV